MSFRAHTDSYSSANLLVHIIYIQVKKKTEPENILPGVIFWFYQKGKTHTMKYILNLWSFSGIITSKQGSVVEIAQSLVSEKLGFVWIPLPGSAACWGCDLGQVVEFWPRSLWIQTIHSQECCEIPIPKVRLLPSISAVLAALLPVSAPSRDLAGRAES